MPSARNAEMLMPVNSSVLGVEYKINLLEAPIGERFLARGVVIKPGRVLSIVECDVQVVQGGARRPVARMLATMMCVEGRSELPD